MTIRWGLLGAGGIARTFAADLKGAGLTVAAVGSRDAQRAEAFVRDEGLEGATAHGSYEALVADPGVDAVYVATPHPFHVDDALLALSAGKHVLVEKPFTVTAAEARRVTEAARDSGLVALEAMWTRYLPQSARLREVVRAGTIGDVRLLVARHVQSLPTDPDHRLNDPALGGGALLDLGVYPVSFAHDLLGAPTAVHASAVLSDRGVDRRVAVTLEHEGGATSQLYAALDVAAPNPATLVGTAGRIEVDDTFYAPGGFTVLDGEGTVLERHESDEGDLRGMHHQALELQRLVEAGETESPVLTGAESVAVMATMDEVRRQVGVRYAADDPA